MKTPTAILAIFLLGLNLLPCADASAEDTCGTEVHFHTSTNQENETDADHCSPFCQCFCCHIQIANTQIDNLNSDFSIVSIKRLFFIDNGDQEFYNSLLQPPQV